MIPAIHMAMRFRSGWRRREAGMAAVYHACWRSRENHGGRQRLTAAMQAGITKELWTLEWLYDEVMA